MTAMVNIFQVSKEWGQGEEERIRKALKQQKTVIPQASVQPKDHKPIPASGIPKSRFFISAVSKINEKVNQITTMTLQNIVKSDQSTEVGSTENMLHAIEEVNSKI